MTTKKKEAVPKVYVRPKARDGWLVCDDCGRAVPYRATGDISIDHEWPQHRCGFEIRPFTRWTTEDPTPPLPPSF